MPIVVVPRLRLGGQGRWSDGGDVGVAVALAHGLVAAPVATVG